MSVPFLAGLLTPMTWVRSGVARRGRPQTRAADAWLSTYGAVSWSRMATVRASAACRSRSWRSPPGRASMYAACRTRIHAPAALVWGLPLLATPDRTHVIGVSNPARNGTDIVRHVHELPAHHQTVHLGHPVTTLERTVVDCAMTMGPRASLVLADAALRVGVDRGDCARVLAGMQGRRGTPAARAILDLADDGAESPGESSARFVLLRAGLPVPQTQVRVHTHLGTFWSDLGWPEWRLLAEYDGRAKYEANGSASEAVIQEKRRQSAVEEADWRMLRITKEDVAQPATLVRRVKCAAPDGAVGRLRPRAALMTPPSSSSS